MYSVTVTQVNVQNEISPHLQEIDGGAFMLLNSDMMMKYLGLKLGPVLKLGNIIEKLRGKKSSH